MASKKKNWKKGGKSRISKRTRRFAIQARGSGDLTPEKEIEAVYNYIRKHPGKMKSQIIKKSGSFGMTRARLMSRWDTIRDYLRDVGENNLDRRNPDGEPWIFGVGVKKMKYYATDKSLDFVPAEPVSAEIEYTRERYPSAQYRTVEDAFKAEAVPVIDEPDSKIVDHPPVWSPPEIDMTTPEEALPLPEDMVTIRYRGCVIRIPAGSDITLD